MLYLRMFFIVSLIHDRNKYKNLLFNRNIKINGPEYQLVYPYNEINKKLI